MTEREQLAADLMAAERVISFNAVHNPRHAALAKAWLRELEGRARALTSSYRRDRHGRDTSIPEAPDGH